MTDTKELAKYIYKKIQELHWTNRAVLFQKLTPDTIESWINHRKMKEGHSVWSEKFKKNIWVDD